MGSDNFFSKFASIDPIAQALDAPGAHKYAQAQAQDVQTNAGPYAGQTPTLAASKEGYTPGSTAQGAVAGWTPNQASTSNGLFGILQKGANTFGNVAGAAPGVQLVPQKNTLQPNFSSGNPAVQQSGTVNPYVTAAQRATVQPANQTWGG